MAWSDTMKTKAGVRCWEREGEWSGNDSEEQRDSDPASRPSGSRHVDEKHPSLEKAAGEACPGKGLGGRASGLQRGGP